MIKEENKNGIIDVSKMKETTYDNLNYHQSSEVEVEVGITFSFMLGQPAILKRNTINTEVKTANSTMLALTDHKTSFSNSYVSSFLTSFD